MNNISDNPLVSIIVRTKDRPKLLNKALQSIASQTYRPIEVVLVNDGGCDLPEEELKEILGDVSLNYIRLKENRGRAGAGNVGIENAKGGYIGFLDDDDEFYPEHVATLADFLSQNNFKVAYTDSLMVYKKFDPETHELIDTEKELVFSSDFDYSFLIFENYIPFMCLLFDREALIDSGGFDNSFEIYEDWDLLLRIGEKFPFYHISQTTADYNQWCSVMQISQRNKDYDFVEQSYLKVLSKHINKFTEKRIHSYISNYVRTREGLKKHKNNIKNLLKANVSEKDFRTQIETLMASVWEKDALIEKLKTTIEDLKTAIKSKDTHIGNLESNLKDKDTYIGSLEAVIKDKDTALNNIYNSHGWKALLGYYKIRDKLFPPNSRRRLFIRLFIIMVENPKELLKSLNKNNIKKFFAQYKVLEPSVLESKVRRKTSFQFTDKRTTNEMIFNEGDLLSGLENLSPPKGKNNVLVVDRFVPTYDKDSGSLRMYFFLVILNELGYKVTFLPDDMNKTEPYTGELQKMGIEILYGDVDIESYLRKTGHIFSFVILSRPEQVFKYISVIRAYALNSTVIYDTVDLHWLRFERAASATGKGEFLNEAKHYKSMELFNASCSDVVFTITKDEKDFLLKEVPELKIEVIPNIHDVVKVDKPFIERKDLMFIGGFTHQPNEDAVFYFIKEIFPTIKKAIADIRFFIIGSDPADAILRLNSRDVLVTGYEKDVMPYFENCRVFVSPLRYGAGMKGKIGQSMAYGLPVVTTTIGAEGIGLVNGDNALIANNPKEFADSVIKLYTDKLLWEKISKNSIEHIEKKFSKDVLSKKISAFFNSIKTDGVSGHITL